MSMQRTIYWVLLWFCAAFLTLLMFYSIAVVVMRSVSPYATARHMVYSGYTFSEYLGTVESLFWNKALHPNSPPPPLYLRIPELPGEVHYLPNLKEEIVASIAISKTNLSYNDELPQFMYKLNQGEYIAYDKGVIVRFSIVSGETEMSLKQEGPFVKLPASRREIERVFGKPLEYRRLRKLPT